MRHHLLRTSLAASVLVIACGGTEPRPASPAPAASPVAAPPPPAASSAPLAPVKVAPEKLTASSPRTTPGGATFTAPAGWTIDSDASRVILTGPEPDLRIGLVDTDAPNADAAVAAAWPLLHPDFKWAVKLSQARPARDGWDERRTYSYETSPDEKLTLSATARRHGASWTVLLVDAGDASVGKRAAAISLVAESLRPGGYAKESFAGRAPHELDAARIKQITDMVDRARDLAGIPGVAISLFQGDKVLFQGGFGARELGKPAKVDADTLFIIASNTKALTTLLLAELIDDGKFTWETPVTRVYPAFKLGDADTTSKVLMKHLVCACTGLPRQDLEWLLQFKGATPKSEMDLLGTFQPTTGFGEAFQYSNLLAAAAGFVGGAVADPRKEIGAAYDGAMKARVFGPLGMTTTTFDYGRALRGDHASPHSEDIDGRPSIASMDINHAITPLRPAGGAWSSVRDLTRYAQMEVAKGKLPNGKRLVSEENLLARRTPQATIGEHTTYGMGLEVDTGYGVPVVHHGGSMIGFKSDMFWLPEQGIGGVVLTNSDSGRMLLSPFVRKTLEVLFDGRPEAEEDLAASAKTRHEQILKDRERIVVPPAPETAAKLAPHYRNAALGEITVRAKGAARTFDFGEWASAVGSRKNDDGTSSILTTDPGVGGFELVVAERDGKRALVLRDMQHEYVFLETP